ncbi:hypothetical protein ACQKNT_27305 [Bacillus cereus]|uniref:hypothetical protein n=1 Tax=Bacillus cereus group TaxID=86661 RepID=UPI000279BBD4|nr:hypothetical protein [Bacillus cereus]EJR82308.1 hypothetical protein IKA_05440 [Bacillus cereus VD169]
MNRNVVVRKTENPVHKHISALVVDKERRNSNRKLTEVENTTLEHALRVLSHSELVETLILNGEKIPSSIKKNIDLVEYVKIKFDRNDMPISVYTSLREKAFNPELNTTDGFFLTYSGKVKNLTEEKLDEYIRASNKEYNEDGSAYKAVIKKESYENKRCKLLVNRIHYGYVFDKHSMFSTKFVDENKIWVEIDFDKEIIFFQTSNVVKFRAVKTIVKDFLRTVTGINSLNLNAPKLSQTLDIELESDKAVSYNINPSTIKLLDLFMQLENDTTNFGGFECQEIVFDHKDSNKKNRKERIDRQGYGGGDLLKKEDVKNLVLDNRDILEIEFLLEYNQDLGNGSTRKHTIVAGINNRKKDCLRIYIKNNNLNIKMILRKAYFDLKEVFIEHYADNKLKSDEKIKKLLGI